VLLSAAHCTREVAGEVSVKLVMIMMLMLQNRIEQIRLVSAPLFNRPSDAHMAYRAGHPFTPTAGQSVRQNLVFNIERPIKSPQLFADFAPLIAMFKRLGDIRAQPPGAKAGWTGLIVVGLGVDLRFHVLKKWLLVLQRGRQRRSAARVAAPLV